MYAKHASSLADMESLAPRRRWGGRRSWLSLGCLALLGLALLLILGASSPPRNTAPAAPESRPAPQETAAARPEREPLLILKAGDIPILKSLQERQARLVERENLLMERETQLNMREAALRLVQQQIEEKLSMLSTLRKEMGEVLQEQAMFEEKRFEHLIKVYDVMKPADVSSLVSRLNEDTAVRLLYQMKEKKVGQILAALTPDVAAKLSERLAVYRQQAAQTPPAKDKP
ncbi:MAG: MotE family protein [Candidatus Tectimicrobiota bacterium]